MSISSIDQSQAQPFAGINGFTDAEASQSERNSGHEGATLSRITDGASLSSLAPRIQGMLNDIAAPGDNVMEALADNVSRLQDGFIDGLYNALSARGIDLSSKLTLRMGSDDMLAVAGDHPEKEQVEAVLREQPALSTAFGEIASQSEVLRDIKNISKVVTRRGGLESYARQGQDPNSNIYQMSLKGEMSHFYFSQP